MRTALNSHPQRKAVIFIVLTVLLSWPVWIAGWFATGCPESITASSPMLALVYFGSFAPGLSAAVLSGTSGRHELKIWLRDFIRVRCGWRAYIAALLPLSIVILLLTFFLGYTPRQDRLNEMPAIAFYLTIFPVSLYNGIANVFIGAGPLGEEGGWRGYLLPRLLEHNSEARASLLIGIVWALWHIPVMAMFSDWRGDIPFLVYLPIYTVWVTGLSFIMTRVWRLAGGSLVPCMWLHGLVNTLGANAFQPSIWASKWSTMENFAHLLLATIITAGLLVTAHHKTNVPE